MYMSSYLEIYKERYGAKEFLKMNNEKVGYYRYEVKIYDKELASKLNYDFSLKEISLYKVLSIEEIENIFGKHFVEANLSCSLYGKIFVCEVYDHVSKIIDFYNAINYKWSQQGYQLGIDYEFVELSYARPHVREYESSNFLESGEVIYARNVVACRVWGSTEYWDVIYNSVSYNEQIKNIGLSQNVLPIIKLNDKI